jgi:hypothetical protein
VPGFSVRPAWGRLRRGPLPETEVGDFTAMRRKPGSSSRASMKPPADRPLLTQDDCPSVSVSRMRALGEVRDGMGSVLVTIAGVTREVGLWHMRFPNGGSWSYFVCPCCGRRARILKLLEKIGCWRCTRLGPSSRPLRWKTDYGDRSAWIEKLRRRLAVPARVKPRPGRTLDRRWRTEQALRVALMIERRGMKGARDVLAKEGPEGAG